MRPMPHTIRIAGITVAALLASCATTPQVDPVAQQLGSQQQQITELQQTVSRLQAVVDGIGAAGIGSSLTSVEEELRQLRGDLESVQYELRDMQQRRASVGGSRSEVSPPPPTTPNAASVDSGAQDDQASYLAAFGKLKSGAYGDAIRAFEQFLTDYPSSAYAPNAQYWIGEAYYVQKNWDAAWTSFEKVGTSYPDSLKAADARFKQGLIRVDQGKISEARKILQQVTSQYAGSSAARLAAERLQRMGGG